ncbi:Yip1 family protein [Streptomyces sp. CL7]|uniref:Yip1 family protein n=1 Tax=Streptomyces sp. CL7 TaxID=3096006 RepID=UPI002A7557B3|nr:Yip1 family protein [Streptomyces sp. CL7]WPP34088.1 Yip1 family protein [Streptomyces sp. CL7]
MSQLGSKARPRGRGPAHGRPGTGTFEDVAGFRIGRGRNNDGAPQGRPPHPPHGRRTPPAPSYGYPPAPQPPAYGQGAGGTSPWPQPHAGQGGYGGHGGHGEPEYFGDGGYPAGPHGAPHDPYAANNPGHTQAFSIDDPYQQDDAYQPPAGPVGPRLHWKALLKGIVLSPPQTFLRMRDYTMWGPALVVTFLYGLLAVFGFDGAREDAINATLSNAIPIVLTTAVAMVLSAFVLGVVTHTLARQLGGNGAWQPTVGLSMLIMSISDAPRLLVAIFAGGDAMFVQLLGWATWVAGGALLTAMVSRSHDLPWPKALGASSIQLIALLSIVKLGTF